MSAEVPFCTDVRFPMVAAPLFTAVMFTAILLRQATRGLI